MCNRLKKGTHILIIYNSIRPILKKHPQFVKLQANSKNNYAIKRKKGLFSCRHYLHNQKNELYFQTLIEKCEYKDCSLFKLFGVAIELSKYIKDGKFRKVSKDIRNEIITRLIKMIEYHNSFSKITASQCSFLAWLYVHTGNPQIARKIAQKGLEIEYNKGCLEIVSKYENLKF